jgi:hypothetical protein
VAEAKNATKQVKKDLPNILYKKEDFTEEKTFEDNRGLYQKWVNRPEYSNHVGKCNHRACKELGVSMPHLRYCQEVLNGRIIDGIQISEMINRYGVDGSENINRAALSLKYKKTVHELQTAYIKLIKILQDRNPLERFMKYQKEYEDLLLKVRRDQIVNGE